MKFTFTFVLALFLTTFQADAYPRVDYAFSLKDGVVSDDTGWRKVPKIRLPAGLSGQGFWAGDYFIWKTWVEDPINVQSGKS